MFPRFGLSAPQTRSSAWQHLPPAILTTVWARADFVEFALRGVIAWWPAAAFWGESVTPTPIVCGADSPNRGAMAAGQLYCLSTGKPVDRRGGGRVRTEDCSSGKRERFAARPEPVEGQRLSSTSYAVPA